ncbi:GntR family transcriptional regulator [Alkalihalobacillus sp. MEB130]|uniref:GntR family transcriptional regulator n=1 Tax=Alkalihalobacillus sp. MEB130 TaxID=2976704 RepID=UPI0028DE8016|nr:GntR family transcriptional regulator [Alkalihalobacillus sp. MEB130]MDT8860547.1 GntR family transcriptional regulator [Alkalihalobacillus sp. MEB130]
MKLPIRVSEESREPIYHQIEAQVTSLIVGGQLPPGTPLPSIRVLSNDLKCSVITTRRAYQNLESKGFIKTVQGKGTFVKEMETEKMEETKQKVVMDAFERAVTQAEQVGLTAKGIRAIFDNVMNRREKGEEEGD